MGNPGALNPLPSGATVTRYYTRIDALTDAQGNPTNLITPDEGSVTVSGITDAPPTGGTVEAVLFKYQEGGGLPEEGSVAAISDQVAATDLHETDSNGKELYSWSVTLQTAGLSAGLYALQSFVNTTAIVTTNGVPASIPVSEPDEDTVTVSEFVPFTYVVHEDTEVVSVGAAQTDNAVYLPNATSTVQLSSDGRYVVWTNGDQYEEDLQTGATIDLTATGIAAPGLATTHTPTVTEVFTHDPYGPVDNGGYGDTTFPSFTAGGVTFGTIPGFDFNANDGSQNPLPTVTDSAGNTSVLQPFGVSKAMAGYAAAASANGNAVLTVENTDITYIAYGSDSGLSASPQYYVVYRSPAPRLTIDPVNGSNQFGSSGQVTLTGTSDAIGQVVEIDFGQAGAKVGTAKVQADGSWSYSFDAATVTGPSLFIEASVSSAAGTPAQATETATVSSLPPATLTSITGQDETDTATFGPTETLTITLDTSEAVFVTGTPTLTLSNGEAASYTGGSGTQQISFTYVPGIHDAGSSDLAVTGLNLPSGASIADADGSALSGPFTQSLGIALQTEPVIASLDQPTGSSDFLTDTTTPAIVIDAEVGETITLYDNGTAIGTGTVNDFGEPGISSVEITPDTPLPQGQSTLTASAVDASGRSSSLSDPVTITVDTTPPAERVLSLAVNGTNSVGLAQQAALSVTVTGRLSAPLQVGETVVVVLPNGDTQTVTPAAGVTGFSVTVDPFDAEAFGVSGSVSAFVVDAAGNAGATTSQAYTAASQRVITPASGDPADPTQSEEAEPALSGNGKVLAFAADPQSHGSDAILADADSPGITAGIYLKDLSTGTVTLAVAGGDGPSLSDDGTVLAYEQDASFPSQVHIKNLTTGTDTLVSARNGVAGDGSSYDASLSRDGTKVAFISSADNLVSGIGTGLSNNQVYVATLSGGAVSSLDAISIAPSDGSQGNGTSDDVALSGDGSEVVFTSDDSNLLAAGDAHTAHLGGFDQQVYVKALTANAASGLQAGQMVLVTGNADGSVGDGTSGNVAVSANGRYVVFTSASDNLAPGSLAPGTVLPAGEQQVYVKDLQTGTLTLVSQTANGVVGDGGALSATISDDGQTIVFSDNSDNLVPGASDGQLYEATLSDGVVTSLSLVSEAGAVPGDGDSTNPSLSADGTTVAFQSTADNLAAGTAAGTETDPDHVYTTTITPAAPTPPPTTLTVTNTHDSGAGSLRAALAAAHDGDTIVFAAAIAGGTIALASSLTVSAGVTIDGLGKSITVSGNNAVTVFDVAIASDHAALIEGLTIADGLGSAPAQPQAADGEPVLAGTVTAGGIDLSRGQLTVLQDEFAGNKATGGTGGGGSDGSTGGASAGAAGGGAGGAIAVGTGASLSATGLGFSSDTATGGAGGAASNANAGDKAAGGSGGAAGGAIFVAAGATATLSTLSLDADTAVGGAGGAAGGTGGAGGSAGGAVYVSGGATVAANGLSFSGDTATGGNGASNGNANVGLKGAGLGGYAAGAIYVDGGTALTPFDFTYTGDSAGTGTDGNGDAGTSGGGNSIYAYAYTDTNLGTASVPEPSGSTGEDGYIVGATVAYANGSGPPATTDALGGFTLTGGTGPIMLTGGTDSATGLAFTDTLTAPAGSTVISPLTTLVEAVVEAAGNPGTAGIATADALVLKALDLPSGIDPTGIDAEGTLLGGTSDAATLQAGAQLFEADNYLESAARLVTAAGGSATGMIAAIAAKLAAGQTIDLTDPSALFANAGLSAAATTAVVDIANATLGAVEGQLGSVTNAGVAFVDVSGASIADQRDAVALLAAAARTGTDAAFEAADASFVAGLPQTLATDDAEVACFAQGTRIATQRGLVAVEDLAIGDHVLIQEGSSPVTWIGHREVRCGRHSDPRKVHPVRVAANAFGDAQPLRDLFLSPDHALFQEGVLIPVKYLIDGSTIRQIAVETVRYYHVALARHAVLLAEGLPAESYLDTGDRQAFADGTVTDLHPAWGCEARDIALIMDAIGYAPLRVSGPEVDQVRLALTRSAQELLRPTRNEASSRSVECSLRP